MCSFFKHDFFGSFRSFGGFCSPNSLEQLVTRAHVFLNWHEPFCLAYHALYLLARSKGTRRLSVLGLTKADQALEYILTATLLEGT
jgi:hypothetical protein